MTVSQQLVLIFAFGSAAAFCEAAASDDGPNHLVHSFGSFIQRYGRQYSADTKEYELRRNIYEKALQQVQHQNSQPDRLWNAAVNHLTDRTEAELSQLRGLRVVAGAGKKPGVIGAHNNGQFLAQMRSDVLPDEKSWAHLTSVQQDVDQGGCGSCWAIATSMALQSNAEIYGVNRTFSAQELVDCVPNPHNCGGSGGCQGATVELGMNWIMAQGLDTDTGTPYQGTDGACKKQSTSLVSMTDDHHGNLEDMIAIGFHAAKKEKSPTADFRLIGWERLPENEYEPLIRAVAQKGPVAVSVGAGGWSGYGNGIFNGCEKDSEIDHAVTLVGYGIDKESKQKYWRIKNSWGNSWGEGGDIRLLREDGKVHCGTDNQPKVGTGCDGGPATVPVCGMCGILYDAVVPHFEKAK